MFRAIGDAIWWVITIPVRMFRAFLDGVASVQGFLDKRRYHLCAGIVALMMAVVGIEMRHSGYADARPGEYTALAPAADQKRPRKSLSQAFADSLAFIKSKIPSLTGSDAEPEFADYEPIEPVEPIARPEVTEAFPETQIPVITASQQRSIMPPPPTDKPGLPAPPKQTLVLPEPTVIDLAELDETPPPIETTSIVPSAVAPPPPAIEPEVEEEVPDIASLSGKIEFDDEPEESGSIFDKQ